MAQPSLKQRNPQQRRRRKRSAQVVKLIVTGSAGAGKSQFIETVSQYTEWQNVPGNGWFFGRVRVDDSLILHFLEPPIEHQYDFMWLRDVMSRIRATGFVVLVDSTRPQQFGEFLSIVYTIRGYHSNAPLVVAANKQDQHHAWTSDDIRLGLGIRDLSVLPCSAFDHRAVRGIVVDLLYQVLA